MDEITYSCSGYVKPRSEKGPWEFQQDVNYELAQLWFYVISLIIKGLHKKNYCVVVFPEWVNMYFQLGFDN